MPQTRPAAIVAASISATLLFATLSANLNAPHAQDPSPTHAATALERATAALEQAQRASDTATRAQTTAQEALSASQVATSIFQTQVDTATNLLYIFSAIAGVFFLLSWFMELHRRHREQDRFNILLQRESTTEAVQIDVGQELSGVRKFVKTTFADQHQQSLKQSELTSQVGDLQVIIQNQNRAYANQFDRIYNDLQPFTKLSRMELPYITYQERHVLSRAELRFEAIDAFSSTEGTHAARLAQVCFMLGFILL